MAHWFSIPMPGTSNLDANASCLGMSLSGNHAVKVTSLETYEKQALEMVCILSHTEVFSCAAFKSLQQEDMDARVLSKLLESISIAFKDSMSIAVVQLLVIQQTRREAAISSASIRSLNATMRSRN